MIIEDFKSNKKSGFLVFLFLINYRIGRYLLYRKSNNLFISIIYVIPFFMSRIFNFIYNCSIPFSCDLGKGICFRHGLHGVFISGESKIGDYCYILHHVTIGSNFGASQLKVRAPVIESNVFVGAGAKIIGGLTVGENSKIGANSLIVKDIPQNSTCFAPLAKIETIDEK
ncbi:serine O-acetyltransferase [Vibrio splendidus]